MLITLPYLSFAITLVFMVLIEALCECGYSVNSTSDPLHAIYTDVLESDWTKLDNIRYNTDWRRQEYTILNNSSHGPYGQTYSRSNVITNPIKNGAQCAESKYGGTAGLELIVRSDLIKQNEQEVISGAELDSVRTDMFWGSYRAGIKFGSVNGTCGAFFWYYNDTQEIDMEFLSSELDTTSSSINLVLHSVLSYERGSDASKTPAFKVVKLPFRGDDAVHEYRFDFSQTKVSFYIDGSWIYDMTESEFVPKHPGGLIIKHWSNGNPLWSGGPPEMDTTMLVTYTKAYFNSSMASRISDFESRCKAAQNQDVCQIPDQMGPPAYPCEAGLQPFFFSQNPDTIRNQSVYRSTATTLRIVSANWVVILLLKALIIGGIINYLP